MGRNDSFPCTYCGRRSIKNPAWLKFQKKTRTYKISEDYGDEAVPIGRECAKKLLKGRGHKEPEFVWMLFFESRS